MRRSIEIHEAALFDYARLREVARLRAELRGLIVEVLLAAGWSLGCGAGLCLARTVFWQAVVGLGFIIGCGWWVFVARDMRRTDAQLRRLAGRMQG